MKKNLIYTIIAAILLIAIILLLYPGLLVKKNDQTNVALRDSSSKAEKDVWTCVMHQWIALDHPGACPICGMTLVKKIKQVEASGDKLAMLKMVSLSPTQRVLANISTTQVERRTIDNEINAIGIVDFAEPLQSKITARFRGRIEKMYANFTGDIVKAGQPLFDLYSPDLVSAEQEYLLALTSQTDSDNALYNSDTEQRLLEAAKNRLRNTFGMTYTQLHALDSTRQSHSTVTFYSPLSGTVITKDIQEGEYVDEGSMLYQIANLSKVWVYLDVYEKDVQYLKVNQTIHVTADAYPNELFTGRVAFIDPVLNPETRTIRVRAEFENPQNKLKPQMWVKAHVVLPGTMTLVVPTSAVLETGKRNVVWVEVKENMFEPRDVTLGVQTDMYTEITSNLNEGEQVVTSGGYLIDSESQLQASSGSAPASTSDSTQKQGNGDNSMPGMNMNDDKKR